MGRRARGQLPRVPARTWGPAESCRALPRWPGTRRRRCTPRASEDGLRRWTADEIRATGLHIVDACYHERQETERFRYAVIEKGCQEQRFASR